MLGLWGMLIGYESFMIMLTVMWHDVTRCCMLCNCASETLMLCNCASKTLMLCNCATETLMLCLQECPAIDYTRHTLDGAACLLPSHGRAATDSVLAHTGLRVGLVGCLEARLPQGQQDIVLPREGARVSELRPKPLECRVAGEDCAFDSCGASGEADHRGVAFGGELDNTLVTSRRRRRLESYRRVEARIEWRLLL